MPTILGLFLFNSRVISLDACVAQISFIHSLQFIESSMLLLMAFDRFIAICNSLRYASILTLPRIANIGLVFVLRAVAVIFPLPFPETVPILSSQCPLPFLCLHQDVMKLVRSDITVNNIYGLFITVITVGLDSLLISLSYVILKAVLSITSPTKCLRALNTCVSHLCAVLLFYMPEFSLTVKHRFWKSSSPLLQIILGYIYLLVPPLMNPIVYSMKSNHLRARIIWVFVSNKSIHHPAPELVTQVMVTYSILDPYIRGNKSY
ncbi:olfactory receptor 51G2-like [Mauremys mutica]|uniref:olfactory receptor 51G2-like n=1 Tax=Mauremys mutica TaxID=74926 RepID=UPI001D134D68|nr:olfactory receptor 51G2-like [Mauremys mutica]